MDTVVRQTWVIEQTVYCLRNQWKHFGFVYFQAPLRTELGYLVAEALYSWVRRNGDLLIVQEDDFYIDWTRSNATGFEAIEPLLAQLKDPLLTELWQKNTYKSVLWLLSHNLVRMIEPTQTIWNAPDQIDERYAVSTVNPTPAEYGKLIEVAKIYPDLKPFPAYGQPSVWFTINQAVVGFNPYANNTQAEEVARLWRISIVRAETGVLAESRGLSLLENQQPGESLQATARRAIVTLAYKLQTTIGLPTVLSDLETSEIRSKP